MKSQERHELETNALAKVLARWAEQLAPYSSHILFGIVALVAALAIWRLSASAWSGGGSEGWDTIATTMVELPRDLSPLKGTSEEFAGTPAGDLAKVFLADTDLYVAGNQFLENKEEAMKRLGTAEETYDRLLKGTDDAVIRERAKLGKARVLEIKGSIAEAIDAYKEVGGIYKETAENRAKTLSEGQAAKYGPWLRQAQGTIPRRDMGFVGGLDFSADPLQLPREAPVSGPAFGDEPMKEFEALQERTPDAPRPDRYQDSGTEGGETGEGASSLFDPPATPENAADTPTGSETAAPAADETTAPPVGETPDESAATPPAADETTPAAPQ